VCVCVCVCVCVSVCVCVCGICVPWGTSFTTGPKADGSERYVSIAVAYAKPGATPCDHIRREDTRTG
jgi:hypothetical protein